LKLVRGLSAQRILFFFFFLLVAFLGVYFRTYSLHGGPRLAFRSSESLARDVVDRSMAGQIEAAIEKRSPGLSVPERKQLAELQIRRSRTEDRLKYEDAVRKAVSSVERARKGDYRYLLEADPYYFLRQTERLLDEGKDPRPRKGGKRLDWFMRAPHGHWSVFLLHPYVGFYWFQIIRFFAPQASLMQILGWLPLFLTLLILPLYAGMGRVLRFPFSASLVGMATLTLSPIFIQRSALGWYDTDPYSYIFPISILLFVFLGLQDRKWLGIGCVGASFLTGLYALFWPGWAFIEVLVPGSILGSAVILWMIQRAEGWDFLKAGLRFCGFYILGSLFFLAVFLTPEGLRDSLGMGWFALNKFALAGSDIWPNIFLTVGEAGSITMLKLIFLTGNYVTFALAVTGLFWEGIHVLRRQDPAPKFRFFFFLLFGAPLLLMSLKTERFSVLFVLPLAIFAGFAVARFVEWAQGWASKLFPRVAPGSGWVRAAALLLVVVLYAPLLLISAHVVALGIKPIMDDVWYAGLSTLRARTPEDAIVDSWWPPGYFIAGIACRRVVLDGGTQEFHTAYWMAKVLMAEDERESAGILRMLNTSGEDAPDLLEKWGVEVPDAVDLLLKIVRLDRAEALQALPSSFSAEQKEQLLDKTHGRGALPPSYVLVYNDLVDQNLAVSIVANWDFRTAKRLQAEKSRTPKSFLGLLEGNALKRYIQDLLQTSGQWLKYTPVSPLAQKKGSLVSFANGLLVDLTSKNARIFIPARGIQGAPASLFFLEQGKLVEKSFEADTLDASALIFEEGGDLYSVIADARLIRSLLFRLYYLKGEGLSLFKPLLTQGSLRGGTFLRVFELERDKLRG